MPQYDFFSSLAPQLSGKTENKDKETSVIK
jgi:hypothetical protein